MKKIMQLKKYYSMIAIKKHVLKSIQKNEKLNLFTSRTFRR